MTVVRRWCPTTAWLSAIRSIALFHRRLGQAQHAVAGRRRHLGEQRDLELAAEHDRFTVSGTGSGRSPAFRRSSGWPSIDDTPPGARASSRAARAKRRPGSSTKTPSSRAPELTLVDWLTSRHVVEEVERNLLAKLPAALPAFRLILEAAVRIVPDPPASVVRQARAEADEKDALILAAARSSGADFLATSTLGISGQEGHAP